MKIWTVAEWSAGVGEAASPVRCFRKTELKTSLSDSVTFSEIEAAVWSDGFASFGELHLKRSHQWVMVTGIACKWKGSARSN